MCCSLLRLTSGAIARARCCNHRWLFTRRPDLQTLLAWLCAACRLLLFVCTGAAEGDHTAVAAPAWTGGRSTTVGDIPALLAERGVQDSQPLGALPHAPFAGNGPAAAQGTDSVNGMPGTLDHSQMSQSGSDPPKANAPTTSGLPSDAPTQDDDGGTTHLTAHEDR